MADVILTREQADDLWEIIEVITMWCPDENYESAMDHLTDNSGIADPVARITELIEILH